MSIDNAESHGHTEVNDGDLGSAFPDCRSEPDPDPFTWVRRTCRNNHRLEVGEDTCTVCGAHPVKSGSLTRDPNATGQAGVRTGGGIAGKGTGASKLNVFLIILILGVAVVMGYVFLANNMSGQVAAVATTATGPQNLATGAVSTGPTSAQLHQAYSNGYFYGQHLNGPESWCRTTTKYSDSQLNAQYQDGCGAGYGGGGSSSNDYGGIAGNQAPSPTAPDVQPYNGG